MRPQIITGTLVAVVVLLQIVSLLALSQATQNRLHDQAAQSAMHELDNTAKRLLNQSQQFLAPVAAQLSISRQLIADGLLDSDEDQKLELYFLSQLRSNTSINAMYLGRADSSFLAVARFEQSILKAYRKPVFRTKRVTLQAGERVIIWREYSLLGERLSQWHEADDNHDPRVLDWYLQARAYNQPVWTNAFSLTGNGSLAIAASVNLHNVNTSRAGVLGVSVELSTLDRLVSSVADRQMTNAVIFDSEFNRLASSTVDTRKQDDLLLSASHLTSGYASVNRRAAYRKFLPPMDRGGETRSMIRAVAGTEKEWFSDDQSKANMQRRLQLFDGALEWIAILHKPVLALAQEQKALVLSGMYRTMGVILVSGFLSLLVIFRLREPLQSLHRRATIDYLTRALNREEFIHRFSRRLTRLRMHQTERTKWVAVVLDLDGFKTINDTHGHDAGDVILRVVVSRLQQQIGRAGFVGRLGGDEFALAMKLPIDVNTESTVEQIRRSVVSQSVDCSHTSHEIGMTAGVAEVQPHETVGEVLSRADCALVAGKSIAKNVTYTAGSQVVGQQPMPSAHRLSELCLARQASCHVGQLHLHGKNMQAAVAVQSKADVVIDRHAS